MIPILQMQKNLMGKTRLCKENCKHEYKEIDYQLKIEKGKKETWYL